MTTKKQITKQQQEAIESSGKVILKSCPGSGKTFVVANKMIYEMNKWKEKNTGIALLTFTNVAADEIMKQIKDISGIETISYPHYIGTIDSFITKFIYLQFGHLVLNCPNKPAIINNNYLNNMIKSFYQWKRQCYVGFSRNSCDPLNYSNNVCNIANIKQRPCYYFKNNLYKQGYASHTDIIKISIKILKDFPQITKILSCKFSNFIIDEAQDTSSRQMDIIDELLKYNTKDIMLIGDPDQNIYQWRDTDPYIFTKRNNTDWNLKELNENFRSSQLICNATHVFSSLDTPSVSTSELRNYTLKPQFLRYKQDKVNTIINYFLNVCKENQIQLNKNNIAVLVRKNKNIIEKDYSYITDLWKTIPTEFLAKATVEIEYGVKEKALDLIEKALFDIFIEKDSNDTDITINTISSKISILNWNKLIKDFYYTIPNASCILSEWKTNIIESLQEMSEKYNLKLTTNEAIKLKTRDKLYPDFLTKPIKSFFSINSNKDFHYGTIHSVKGCNFDAVLLFIDSNKKGKINIELKDGLKDEEIRIIYVAMTRAKKILMVALHDDIKKIDSKAFTKECWNTIDI